MTEFSDRHLADEMTFAKVVNTPNGEALLIAGNVYYVRGPEGNCADQFGRAMRSAGSEQFPASLAVVGSGEQTAA